MNPGRFIVLEGGDAVGKKTQSERLFARLAKEKVPEFKPQPHLYSFPRYKTELGKAILRHLQKEIVASNTIGLGRDTAPEDAMIFQCMMSVDKYAAAAEFTPYWMDGADVVADRWWQSAYVFGAVDGLPTEWLQQIHLLLPLADLNILIDLPVEEAIKRRPEKRDRYEEDTEHREKVRESYIKLWKDAGAHDITEFGRWVILDGMKSEDEIHEAIWGLVEETVPVPITEPAEGVAR